MLPLQHYNYHYNFENSLITDNEAYVGLFNKMLTVFYFVTIFFLPRLACHFLMILFLQCCNGEEICFTCLSILPYLAFSLSQSQPPASNSFYPSFFLHPVCNSHSPSLLPCVSLSFPSFHLPYFHQIIHV